MAHSNGLIYIDTSTTPHKGVEIADLQTVLGRSTGDLGLLCSDQEWYDNNGTPTLRPVNRINKWAKYKPIKDTTLGVLTSATRKSKDQGFVNIYYQTAEACFNAARSIVDGSVANWAYERPVGGIGVSPLRLLDFSNENSPASPGYNHSAENPFAFVSLGSDPADTNRDVKIDVYFYYRDKEISLADLASFDTFADTYSGTWYWCIFAKVPGTSGVQCWHLFTSDSYGTRLTVGSPSSSQLHGFTHFTCSETAFGTVEAYLGFVCIDDLVEPGHTRYMYAPIGRNISFELDNPTGALYVSLVPQSQSYTGMVLTYGNTGEFNEIVSFASTLYVKYVGSGQPVIHVTERVWGYANGDETTYEMRQTDLTVTSSTNEFYINGAWNSFEGVICDPISDADYVVELKVGSGDSVYMYFNNSADLMISASQERMKITDLATLNDEDYTYVEIINNTPD